jgi:hypothetical protein
MIYAPNQTRWPIGALVIHDTDAKVPAMLMVVIGYTDDGLCQSVYLSQSCQPVRRLEVWRNELRFLHDPRAFGIPLPPSVLGSLLTVDGERSL